MYQCCRWKRNSYFFKPKVVQVDESGQPRIQNGEELVLRTGLILPSKSNLIITKLSSLLLNFLQFGLLSSSAYSPLFNEPCQVMWCERLDVAASSVGSLVGWSFYFLLKYLIPLYYFSKLNPFLILLPFSSRTNSRNSSAKKIFHKQTLSTSSSNFSLWLYQSESLSGLLLWVKDFSANHKKD